MSPAGSFWRTEPELSTATRSPLQCGGESPVDSIAVRLQDRRHVASLSNQRDDRDSFIVDRCIDEVVLTDGTGAETGIASEVLSSLHGGLVGGNALGCVVDLPEVGSRSFFTPSRRRPGSGRSEIARRRLRENVELAPAGH